MDTEDAGNYECEASNGVGVAKSYSINVQVLAAPYFVVEPEMFVGDEGETAKFWCKANGTPSPEIKWIHNGKPIEEAPYNSRLKIFPNHIIIEDLKKGDTGNYGCNATNSIGYVYRDVYLNVLVTWLTIRSLLRHFYPIPLLSNNRNLFRILTRSPSTI